MLLVAGFGYICRWVLFIHFWPSKQIVPVNLPDNHDSKFGLRVQSYNFFLFEKNIFATFLHVGG